MSRIALIIFGTAAITAVFACGNSSGDAKKTPDASSVTEFTWSYRDGPWGENPVVVTVPLGASDAHRMPVLFALHGQGESRKSPPEGARGWPDDYDMLKAFNRLAHPPLTVEDFGGMVTDKRLAVLNASLENRPYRGLIVACPYLPDRFRKDTLYNDAAVYGRFLVNRVLPRIRKETPAMNAPTATAIDGVSLGGRASVVIGFDHPSTFGAVGGIQAAFGTAQIPELIQLLNKARKTRPNVKIRLLSSEGDRFKAVTIALSEAFKKENAPHQIDIVKGDHSYAFNRGPGVYEMLIYYDRILRNEPFLP